MLPGAVLVILPKCPLCMAAWLTVATGLSVSGAAGFWVRHTTVVMCVAAMGLIAAQLIRRRGRRNRPASGAIRSS